MKAIKVFLLLLFVYLLQILFVSRFALFGVKADLILIVTTLFAVTYGPEDGFVIGLLFGLIQDILGGVLYMNTFSKAILGFLVGTFKESVLGTEEMVALSAVCVATVTNFLLELVILFFFFGKPVASPLTLFITLGLSCLYNGLFAPFLFPVVRAVSKMVMEQ
jgi:rod shape-determining protein MreD